MNNYKLSILFLLQKSKIIKINNYSFNLDEVSVSSITKLKKELTESALSNLV